MSVPAANLILTINANVDNLQVSDKEFREFVRDSLEICDEVIERDRKLEALSRWAYSSRGYQLGKIIESQGEKCES